MKKLSILSATLLAATAFVATAAEKQTEVKAPILMSDAQMKEVVGGTPAGGSGFGICTAVLKAQAPGAIKNFGPYALANLPGNGNLNSKGLAPGFGTQTAGKGFSDCGG